jgi:hypothetical protein
MVIVIIRVMLIFGTLLLLMRASILPAHVDDDGAKKKTASLHISKLEM